MKLIVRFFEPVKIITLPSFLSVGSVVALSIHMKKMNLKQVFRHSLFGVLLIALSTSVCFSDENSSYKKMGLNGEVGGDIYIYAYDMVAPLPAISAKIGYQFNPYFSIDAKLSTIIFNTMAELSAKANFTDSRLSPYISTSIAAISGMCFNEDDECNKIIDAYNAAVGVSFDTFGHSAIYAEIKVWGSLDGSEFLILPAMGYRYKF